MKGLCVHLSPEWLVVGLVAAPGTQICPPAGTSPDHPHQGSCELSLPLQLMKRAAFIGEKTGEMGRQFSPTVVPPPVFCRGVNSREMGWVDPSLPPALAAVALSHTSCKIAPPVLVQPPSQRKP